MKFHRQQANVLENMEYTIDRLFLSIDRFF